MPEIHTLAMPVGARDHATAGGAAKITLVQYSDYDCPHCARAYPILKNIQRHFGDKLNFVFRNFPLRDKHPHAEAAAELAEAAAAQGKFWEMHDMLFERQRFDAPDLLGYAVKLGLDVERVRLELERRIYRARVDEDLESGTKSGVTETPAFFVNGERFTGNWSGPEFAEAVVEAAHRP
jgi:protein-disulfide isomerase